MSLNSVWPLKSVKQHELQIWWDLFLLQWFSQDTENQKGYTGPSQCHGSSVKDTILSVFVCKRAITLLQLLPPPTSQNHSKQSAVLSNNRVIWRSIFYTQTTFKLKSSTQLLSVMNLSRTFFLDNECLSIL